MTLKQKGHGALFCRYLRKRTSSLEFCTRLTSNLKVRAQYIFKPTGFRRFTHKHSSEGMSIQREINPGGYHKMWRVSKWFSEADCRLKKEWQNSKNYIRKNPEYRTKAPATPSVDEAVRRTRGEGTVLQSPILRYWDTDTDTEKY